MRVKEVADILEDWAPLSHAEGFDNVGLLTGNKDDDVSGILITLDCLENVVDEAIDKGCNLIITFHPIIFSGLKSLAKNDYVSKTVVKAIKNDIAIYAIHTALDNAYNGVSYEMARKLGLKNVSTLTPKTGIIQKLQTYVPDKSIEQVREALFKAGAGQIGNYSECSFSSDGSGTFKGNEESNPVLGEKGKRSLEPEKMLSVTFEKHLRSKVLVALREAHPYEEVAYEVTTLENEHQKVGMGTVGDLSEPLSRKRFLEKIKSTFKTGVVRHSEGSSKGKIHKVALLGGSGAFAIDAAKAAGADAYVTADLKYHDFFKAGDLFLCDVGHYESEQYTKDLLHRHLSKKISNFAVLCAEAQTNPVNYF